MAWLLVLLAALTEVGMAVALKASAGWTKPVPGALGTMLAATSIFLLTKALPGLPTGSAYAVWTGLGAVGVALVGVLFHGDPLSPARAGCIALIVGGAVGLRLL